MARSSFRDGWPAGNQVLSFLSRSVGSPRAGRSAGLGRFLSLVSTNQTRHPCSNQLCALHYTLPLSSPQTQNSKTEQIVRAAFATFLLIAGGFSAFAQTPQPVGGGYNISTAPHFGSDGAYVARSTTTVTPDGAGGYSVSTAPRFSPNGAYVARSTTTITPDRFGGYSICIAPRFRSDGAYVPGSIIEVRPGGFGYSR